MPLRLTNRTLRTRMSSILEREGLAGKVRFAADTIGVAENTLRALIRDDWDQLSRETIERICDRFAIQIDDLFELAPVNFWQPFLDADEIPILTEGTTAFRTFDEGLRVVDSLQRLLPAVRFVTAPIAADPRQVLEDVGRRSCIVTGSPRSNRATEVILSDHFDAEPFNPDPTNRAKIPFRFVFPDGEQVTKNYSTAEPFRGSRSRSGLGIWDSRRRHFIVEVDWWSREEYLQRVIESGHDGAIVMVIRHGSGSTETRTIVVAGFSAVGTVGAMKALLRDFRDLEPVPGARHVLGVVDVTFQKLRPDQDERLILGYRWKHLEGGRKRIAVS